jgi:hypothetical protein
MGGTLARQTLVKQKLEAFDLDPPIRGKITYPLYRLQSSVVHS